MEKLTVKEIGIKLIQAGMLKTSPLCVFGSDTIPANSVPIKEINRCIAHAIFTLSVDKNFSSVYLGEDSLEGCCPGGTAWLGYKTFFPMLKYFLSTGSADFRGGAAEFLIANPELAEEQLHSVGKISPLGKYTSISKCDSEVIKNHDVKAILCFGRSEQIRNLCSLAHFRPGNASSIQIPWGAACTSFISYPAEMINNGPKNCIIIGPTDPTGNYWFPQDYLSMGLSVEIARNMANDLNDSFIIKRHEVAYPVKRKTFPNL